MNRRLSDIEVWRTPVLLAAASLVGLVAALVSDDVGDVVSWIALAAPLAVGARCWGGRETGKKTARGAR